MTSLSGVDMAVRNPRVFVVAVALLASSATLGAILVHDGEVGTDEARLQYLDEGDAVKVKGTLESFTPPTGKEWDGIRAMLHHNTYRLLLPGLDADVLVTGLAEGMAADSVVVEGAVLYNGLHPEVPDYHALVMDARVVTDPFFAW